MSKLIYDVFDIKILLTLKCKLVIVLQSYFHYANHPRNGGVHENVPEIFRDLWESSFPIFRVSDFLSVQNDYPNDL